MPFPASCVDNVYIDVDNVDIEQDGINRQEVSGGPFGRSLRVPAGPGFDLVALFPVAQRFRVGAGAQWNVHDVDFSADAYDVVSLFAEPRLDLGVEAAVTTYYLSFGDFDQEGQTLANSSSSGNALGLRLALALSR